MTTAFADVQRIMSPAQIISIADSKRSPLALWVGAVSAGKTFASLFAFLIALRAAPVEGQIVIVGRTLQSIERNIIKMLQTRSIFGLLAGQVTHTKGSNVAIICGREVALIGASNSTAENVIRGMTVSLAYVDEATIVDRAAFDMLVTRLRVGAQSRLIATTNPGSMNHWLRREYILRADAVGMTVFTLTMDDNPSLDPGYVARMKRTYTGVFYQRFILGEWTNAEGAVYPDWDPNEHVIRFEEMPPIRRMLAVGVDYGTTNPTVALLVGITDERMPGQYTPTPRLILMDEWVDDPKRKREDGSPAANRSHAPSEHAELYRQWLAGSRHMPDHVMSTDPRPPATIVDPAAKAFREQLARPIGQFATGLPTTAADNDVLAGIGDVSMLISNGLLLATDRCVRWNEEVTEYRWDSKKSDEGRDQVVKEADHAMDAGRYGVRTSRGLWLPSIRDAYNLAA